MKNIFWKKCHTLYLLYIGIIGIVIGRYEKFHIGILSVLADKKIEFIGLYRDWPIRKKAYGSYTDQGCNFPVEKWEIQERETLTIMACLANRVCIGKNSVDTIFYSSLSLDSTHIRKSNYKEGVSHYRMLYHVITCSFYLL